MNRTTSATKAINLVKISEKKVWTVKLTFGEALYFHIFHHCRIMLGRAYPVHPVKFIGCSFQDGFLVLGVFDLDVDVGFAQGKGQFNTFRIRKGASPLVSFKYQLVEMKMVPFLAFCNC